ncbi:MAG: OmpA family protein [Methylocystis sp.]|uniref:OmpA family protein n=1 Tax=Methylocystis sp. TaxID=1911079 RepID=UPI003D10E7C1
MDTNFAIGRNATRDRGAPEAWVWRHYTGELPQSQHAHAALREGDSQPNVEKGMHPVAITLGVAVSFAVVCGLSWLFTPGAPPNLGGGSVSDQQSYTPPPVSMAEPSTREANSAEEAPAPPPVSVAEPREANSAEEAPAPPPAENPERDGATTKNSMAPGIEDRLRAFLEHGPAKGAQFDLAGVAFAAGTAALSSTAREELQRVARVVKAYPGVHVSIGAHSAAGERSAKSEKLSAKRVRKVRSELMRLGLWRSSLTLARDRARSDSAIADACPGCVWIYVRKK